MFENLTLYHKLALYSFVMAKMCGMLGVGLGFGDSDLRKIGAVLLGLAFVFIFFSITMSIFQMGKDKEAFIPQDHIARQNAELKKQREILLKEVEELRLEKRKMLNLKIRKNLL